LWAASSHELAAGQGDGASAGVSVRRGFLLLGFPRSGTTLLSRLLDAHPQISCPPETHLVVASARFLREQQPAEGPPLGVLSGLGLLGIPEEDVLEALRGIIFGFHARIAGDAPVWVHKTATDIFHLDTIERLLGGHVRFITLVRNPLDVVPSNLDLAQVLGAQVDELFQRTRGANGPHEAVARVWVERAEALAALVARRPDDCHQLRYEDLVGDPAGVLDALLEFLGVERDTPALLQRAFARPPRFGLGDFRVNETLAIRPHDPRAWRKRVPPGAAARIVPLLAPMMAAHGYAVPRIPAPPSREEAIRQYAMAGALKRQRAQGAKTG
jgi:protein-tyrosine sulfotransferase